MNGYKKLKTSVDIPQSLDLLPFASSNHGEPIPVEWHCTQGCLPSNNHAGEDVGHIHYELYAVVYHSGSMLSGHYTATVKHYASKQWFSTSDSWWVLHYFYLHT